MIITAGELLVEFVSHETGCGLEKITRFSGPYPSGAPAIFIDQAARMGAMTRIYGGVGQDGFGRSLLERLASHGVETDHIQRHADRTTGVAFVSYYDDGTRTFIFHLTDTAADDIGHCEINADQTDLILHVSGSSLGNARLRGCIVDLADRVVSAGGRICCDPNVRPELMKDDETQTALRRIIDASEILLPSEADLEILYPDLALQDAVDRMLSGRARVVGAKLGNQGALVATSKDRTAIPPHKVETVDATGAGDCFCGTFVALLSQGYAPADAGRLANAAGAKAVTRRGPMEGNSNLPELMAFLEAGRLPEAK